IGFKRNNLVNQLNYLNNFIKWHYKEFRFVYKLGICIFPDVFKKKRLCLLSVDASLDSIKLRNSFTVIISRCQYSIGVVGGDGGSSFTAFVSITLGKR